MDASGLGITETANMRTRRDFFRTVPLAASFALGWVPVHASGYGWLDWLGEYVHGGRVIDRQQGEITHSEGQGYGLLLAQAHGDRRSFGAIEDWTEQHLAIREDTLMAWAWRPGEGSNVLDWHTATDGDLFRAWALLRAGRDSGWSGYTEKAIAIAHDIAELCLAPDPRAPEEHLLTPGAESRRAVNNVLINPSYIMPRALRELGVAAREPRLIRAADHGETILAELAATSLLPNWIDVTQSGFEKPREHELLWGYDALRIPLYLTWSGQRDHAAVDRALDLFARSSDIDHLAVVITPTGDILAQSNHPGYRAITEVAACRPQFSSGPEMRQASYYPDSLWLLGEIAFRESGCSS